MCIVFHIIAHLSADTLVSQTQVSVSANMGLSAFFITLLSNKILRKIFTA